MHIAISYPYNAFYQNDYIENELRQPGHTVTFIGPPAGTKLGYDSRAFLTETIAALPHAPDVYLCIDPIGRYMPPGIEDLPMLTVAWLGDIHLGTWRERIAQFFDIVCLPHRDFLPRYQQVVGHSQVYWLPLYVSPHVQPRSDLPRLYDIGFVGNVAMAHRHTPRAQRLHLLTKHFRLSPSSKYYTHPELSQIYSQSKIVFNATISGDVNLRIFEGTACGALVLTDSIANGLPELFEVGQELVVYQDDADLLEKARYYLTHDAERERIIQDPTVKNVDYFTKLHRLLPRGMANRYRKITSRRATLSLV